MSSCYTIWDFCFWKTSILIFIAGSQAFLFCIFFQTLVIFLSFIFIIIPPNGSEVTWHYGFDMHFYEFLIYLLIMLLQLSHFPPFTPLHPAHHLPPTFPPYSSCSWVILISSLASTFPTLFLPSPCLFSTYHLCYLFSVPFPPLSPSCSPIDNPPCDLHFCGSVPILVVCLVCFCFCFRCGC